MKSRFKHKTRFSQWLSILIFIVVAFLWIWEEWEKSPSPPGPGTAQSARCIRVVDGDTLDIKWPNGKRERVRVLGIDCMESHHEEKRARQARRLGVKESVILQLSKQATRTTTSALLNQPVSLVYAGETPAYNPYNRLLCYVEHQGQDLGAVLLEQGLAEARREPHPRKPHYQEINRTARSRRVGIYR